MVYTAYSEEEYKMLPKYYRNKVLGIEIPPVGVVQTPLCPDCGGEMMEDSGYLMCVSCGAIHSKRIIRDD